MKLKNITLAILASVAVSAPAFAADLVTAVGLTQNMIGVMEHIQSHQSGAVGGAFVFNSATRSVDQFISTAMNYNTSYGVYAMVNADRFDINILPNTAGESVSKTYPYNNPFAVQQWTETPMNVDVYQNGVLICKSCDALAASAISGGKKLSAVLYKDRRFSNYVVGGLKGYLPY